MKYRDTFFKELHKLCGVCGHCGKPKCAHKATHSILPSTIAADDIFTAFERADIALNVTYSRIIEEPQELERSPNTSSTGNGKMFVMGRDGLNPSPAGSSPYEPHIDKHGEKSQAPFFVHPNAIEKSECESLSDVLEIVGSYGKLGDDINQSYRYQIILANEVMRLRTLVGPLEQKARELSSIKQDPNSWNTSPDSGSCALRLSDEEIESIRLEFKSYAGEGHDLEMLCDQAKLATSLERNLNIVRRQIITCEHGCPHNRYCEICDED